MTDLAFHGDQDARRAALEVAVNTHPLGPPEFLLAAIAEASPAHYPDDKSASLALARCYGLPEVQVLPTAGGAEGFTLVARGLEIRKALVVHPQFTEPEAALRAARIPVERFILEPDFQIPTSRLIDHARASGSDVVFVGNPTNPTSQLHTADQLCEIVSAGLRLVVDEAFMDASSDPAATMLGRSGVIVLRSFTKLWSIPGIRVGWLSAEAGLLKGMRAQQPPWSVSAAALAAISAIASAAGSTVESERRGTWMGYLHDLVARLGTTGVSFTQIPTRHSCCLTPRSPPRPTGCASTGWLCEEARHSPDCQAVGFASLPVTRKPTHGWSQPSSN